MQTKTGAHADESDQREQLLRIIWNAGKPARACLSAQRRDQSFDDRARKKNKDEKRRDPAGRMIFVLDFGHGSLGLEVRDGFVPRPTERDYTRSRTGIKTWERDEGTLGNGGA
jgi:hypothetical protein